MRELSMFMWDLWSAALIPTYTTPSQITDFIQDIEGDLQAVHDALKAGCDPGKRRAYCLFVDNLNGIMSIPTDLPIVWCIPPVTSKAWSPIILTLITVPQGCACITLYAGPPCSSVMMIPNSALNV